MPRYLDEDCETDVSRRAPSRDPSEDPTIEAIDTLILALSLGYCALVAGVAAALRRWWTEGPQTLFLGLLLGPLVAYLILSGGLTQISGFGVEARFAQIAGEAVEPTAPRVLATPPIGGTDAALTHGSAVTFLEVEARPAESEAFEDWVYSLATSISAALIRGDFDLLVVLTGAEDRVVGYYGASWFEDLRQVPLLDSLIEGPGQATPAWREPLRRTLLWKIASEPVETTESWGRSLTVRASDGKLDVLRRMIDHEANVVVVVDDEGRYVGSVTRSSLVGTLITSWLAAEG